MKPLKILHIDDSSILRKTVNRGLEAFKVHYELTQVESVDEALALLTSNHLYDVILTDWLMVGKSGLNLLCILKSHPEYHRLPVFFLTSEYDSASLIIAVTHGASGIIKKPVTGPEIHAYLQKKLSHIEECHVCKEDCFVTEAKPLLKELQQMLSLKNSQQLASCLPHIQSFKAKASASKWPLLADYSQRMIDSIQNTLEHKVEMLTPMSRLLTEYHSFMDHAVACVEIGKPHPLMTEMIDRNLKNYLTNLEVGWFTNKNSDEVLPDGVFIPREVAIELQQHLTTEGLAILEPYLAAQKKAS